MQILASESTRVYSGKLEPISDDRTVGSINFQRSTTSFPGSHFFSSPFLLSRATEKKSNHGKEVEKTKAFFTQNYVCES